jgi:alginate O-acetyltransferase complex protein AlgI
VLFFPKLLSGPIVPYRLFVVTKIGETVGIDVVKDGLRRFAFGLAKKVLIADHLGKTVNAAFELDVPNYPPFVAWLVLIGFALQLYFDFSGYMDMSLGLGRVFGVQLPENFNDPYTARSISEFWRRWHMTLSAWFREYVFYPLERQRLPILGQQFNILFVFLLTGLWHGLTPTFMVWGLIHGAAIVFEGTAIGKRLRLAWPPIQHFYALSVILFSWVFFRSNSLEFAGLFIRRLLGDTSGIQILPFSTTTPLPFIEPTFVVAMISGVIFAMPVANWLTAWKKRLVTHNPAFSFPLQIVWDGAALFLLWAAISALAGGAFSPGIYDKF